LICSYELTCWLHLMAGNWWENKSR
jgi:hypothetical protein